MMLIAFAGDPGPGRRRHVRLRSLPCSTGSYQAATAASAYGVWGVVAGAPSAVDHADPRRSAHSRALVAVDLLRQCPGQRRCDRALASCTSSISTPRPNAGSSFVGMATFTGFAVGAFSPTLHHQRQRERLGHRHHPRSARSRRWCSSAPSWWSSPRLPADDRTVSAAQPLLFAGVLIAALILNFSAFAFLLHTPRSWMQSVLDFGVIKTGFTSGIPLSLAAFVVELPGSVGSCTGTRPG